MRRSSESEGDLSQEIDRTTTVTLFWYGSKGVVANFFESQYRRLVKSNSELARQFQQIDLLGTFVHDLGHNGRGLDAFPLSFQLELCGSISTGREVSTVQPLSVIIEPLITNIVSVQGQFGYPYTQEYLQQMIDALQAMAQLLQTDNISLTFELRSDKGYSIAKLKVDPFSSIS